MVLDDIKKAKSIINGDRETYRMTIANYFSRIYAVTTENLNDYLQYYDFHNKRVLTTGSSADQIFNLVSFNANEIDHFDVNPFVKYYFALKKAAMQELNHRKYVEFFCGKRNVKGHLVLNDKIYQRLSDNLDKDSKVFWDSLYNEYKPSQISEKLFFNDFVLPNNFVKNNAYLDRENYSLVRKRIDNCKIKFINTSLSKLPRDSEQYDYVLLSNIFDYLFNLRIIDEREFPDVMFEYRYFLINLIKILKENGTMFFHYLWEIDVNIVYEWVSNFFRNDKHISTIKIPNSNRKNEIEDAVMVYKKSK